MSGSGFDTFIKALGVQLRTTGGPLNKHQDSELLTKPSASNLAYPLDLFAHGKQAFIFFNIRKAADTSPSYGAVCLYMPSSLRVSYGANYSSTTLPLTKLIETFKTYAGTVTDLITAGTKDGKDMGTIIQNIMAATANDPGAQYMAHNIIKEIGPSYAAEFRNNIGRGLNPFSALIYEHPEFRSFSFEFEFVAKNAAEAEQIRKIIKIFKLAMHPNPIEGSTSKLIDTGGKPLAWDFPYVFDVFLCTPHTDKMFMVKRAALARQDVDYAGSGVQSFFKDGNPVHIKMNLEFKELDLLTRDEIYKNY